MNKVRCFLVLLMVATQTFSFAKSSDILIQQQVGGVAGSGNDADRLPVTPPSSGGPAAGSGNDADRLPLTPPSSGGAAAGSGNDADREPDLTPPTFGGGAAGSGNDADRDPDDLTPPFFPGLPAGSGNDADRKPNVPIDMYVTVLGVVAIMMIIYFVKLQQAKKRIA